MAASTGGSQAQALEANKDASVKLSLENVSADNSIKVGISDEAFTQSLFGVASLVGASQASQNATLETISTNAALANASVAQSIAGGIGSSLTSLTGQMTSAITSNSLGNFLKNNWLLIAGGFILYKLAKKKGWF